MSRIKRIPLDVWMFLLSGPLLVGLFFLPNDDDVPTWVLVYIVYIFVSIFISGFLMTYVRDSEYNPLRKGQTLLEKVIRAIVYIVVCVLISYILVVTEWILLLY